MKRKLLYALIVSFIFVIICAMCSLPTNKKQQTQMEVIEIELLNIQDAERKNPKTLEEATVLISETKERIKNAEQVKESLLAMGYEKDYPAVVMADTEISIHTEHLDHYQDLEFKFSEERKWTKMSHDYPIATQVWKYMKDELGWNDYVCAGVMGNLMAETGGQTLNLNPSLYASGGAYYGIAQWSVKYYPSVAGASLGSQLSFLGSTVQKEINTYGSKYYSGFNYNAFIALTSPSDAALAFAKTYERCGSSSYSVRQSNAVKAYQYFVGK